MIKLVIMMMISSSPARLSPWQRIWFYGEKGVKKSEVGELYYRKKRLSRQSEKKGSLCRRVLKHPKHGHFIRNTNFLQTLMPQSPRFVWGACFIFWSQRFRCLALDDCDDISRPACSIPETWPIVAAEQQQGHQGRSNRQKIVLPVRNVVHSPHFLKENECIFWEEVYSTILWDSCEVGENLTEFANGQTWGKLKVTNIFWKWDRRCIAACSVRTVSNINLHALSNCILLLPPPYPQHGVDVAVLRHGYKALF